MNSSLSDVVTLVAFVILFGSIFVLRPRPASSANFDPRSPFTRVPLYWHWVVKWSLMLAAGVTFACLFFPSMGLPLSTARSVFSALSVLFAYLSWTVHRRYVNVATRHFKICFRRESRHEISLHVTTRAGVSKRLNRKEVVLAFVAELRPVLIDASEKLPSDATALIILSPWYAEGAEPRRRYTMRLLQSMFIEEFVNCDIHKIEGDLGLLNSAVALISSDARTAWLAIKRSKKNIFTLPAGGVSAGVNPPQYGDVLMVEAQNDEGAGRPLLF